MPGYRRKLGVHDCWLAFREEGGAGRVVMTRNMEGFIDALLHRWPLTTMRGVWIMGVTHYENDLTEEEFGHEISEEGRIINFWQDIRIDLGRLAAGLGYQRV